MDNRNGDNFGKRGAGGTPGGIVEFFVGAILIMIGGYLFLSRVIVTTSGFSVLLPFGPRGGYRINSFGLAMLPMLIGIGFLFFSNRSIVGWLLTIGGAGIIALGVLSNLTIYFQPTNLFDTLLMLGMIAGGLGLVARGLQPHNMR